MNWRKILAVLQLATVVVALWGIGPPTAQAVDEAKVPHYFGPYPNWALSPLPVVNPDNTVSGGIRKFVDGLPKLGAAGANNLGQYLPVAVPDTTTYPGSDYYEIAVVQYREKMHSDLPATLLRGYVQLSTPVVPGDRAPLANALLNGTSAPIAGYTGVSAPHYLGPVIVATKNRPVRILFRNLLPAGAGGDLFLPVDSSMMGSGMGQMTDPYDPTPTTGGTVTDEVRNPMCTDSPKMTDNCMADNRATLHLHGGITPWISDGTPHQWITPADQVTPWPKGVSVRNVPDMPDPGPGAMTFFYTNQQSARLMFYHDHSWGITRLNVYAGEAAGYLITDDTEKALINSGVIPGAADTIPLVIQDKTFVPPGDKTTRTGQLYQQDPTWDENRWGGFGSLWQHHVYMPAQNPGDPGGMSAFGRWMYGPWFWPPATDAKYGPIKNPRYNMDPATSFTTPLAVPCDLDNPATWQYQTDPFCEPELIPGTPNISAGMEQFNDTPVVNGTAYPTTTVDPKAYRLRLLNAANDRFFNLHFYVADGTGTEVALKAAELAAAQDDPTVFPTPDTTLSPAGPSWIQIGTEGGFLPAPAVIPPQPITWVTDPTRFDFGNVEKHSLVLAPAERADVIVDFSQYAGKTLILYNDAPAAYPARVPSYDYYTGAPDQSPIGAPGVLPGYGPNTRTVMQIKVNAGAGTGFNLGALQAAFTHKADGSGVFESGQHPIIVGQAAYNSAYGTNFASSSWCNSPDSTQNRCDGFVRINEQGGDLFGFNTLFNPTGKIKIPLQPKAIHDEMNASTFDEFGRMQANLGVEAVPASPGAQNVNLMAYIFPPTEIIDASLLPSGVTAAPIGSAGDGTQIWKITHNGVDTHPIHFHLYDVQLLNRVTWDNIVIPPDANELGWKDTVRISPLQDTIVALRPVIPTLPFDLPNSVRLLDPTRPDGAPIALASTATALGVGIPPTNPNGEPVDIYNHEVNYGAEYVWHCHILSHEEMDMMRPVAVAMPPVAPSNLNSTVSGSGDSAKVDLTWTDNSRSETAFEVQRAADPAGPWNTVAMVASTSGPAINSTVSYSDPIGADPTNYVYRVRAVNVVGDTWNYAANINNLVSGGFPTVSAYSTFSNNNSLGPVAPGNLSATLLGGLQIRLNWNDNSNNESGFQIERSVDGGAYQILFTTAADTTTYTDTPVVPGSSYQYRVAAVNGLVPSSYAVSNTIAVPAAPNAPSNVVTALQVGPRVALSWSDNSNNETLFSVQRSVNGGAYAAVATLGANATSFLDTGVSVGNSYQYRIAAVNGTVFSAYAFSGIITVAAIPTAPSNLAATLQAGPQAALTWTDNSNNETGFLIQRSVNGTPFTTLTTAAAGVTSYTDTTVVAGNDYRYQVAAVNGAAVSSYAVSASVSVPTVPVAPGNVAAALQAGPQALITWTDNSSNETGFLIRRSVNGGAFEAVATAAAGATSYTDSTLAAGNTYVYQVAATNLGGTSVYVASGMIAVPPAAPTNARATLLSGPQLSVTWTDNSSNEAGFVVKRSVNGAGFVTLVTMPANATSYLDADVASGSSYQYAIAAVNGAGTSTTSLTTRIGISAAAPTNLTAAVQPSPQVALNWTDNSGNETGFVIQRSANGGAFTTLVTTAANVTSYTDNTVISGVNYRYQVASAIGSVLSAYAGPVTALVPNVPATPLALTASVYTATSVSLSWTDNSNNETSFAVWRSVSGAAATRIGTVTRTAAQGTTTGGKVYFIDSAVTVGTTYSYYVTALNSASVSSAPSATATVSFSVPAAPATVTAVGIVGTTTDSVRVAWSDRSNNEATFTVQKATNATFTAGLTTSAVAANGTNLTVTGLPRNTALYFRVRANNPLGSSAWVNATPSPIVTP